MSGFQVIPAVDIRGGKCVRLVKGVASDEKVFSADPLNTALLWQEEGAPLIHVVDLDGAFTGKPVNAELIKDIAGSCTVPVEVGGGVRDKKTAHSYLEAGVNRVIMGTAALKNQQLLREIAAELGERLAVGIDAKDGLVAVSGWTEAGSLDPLEAVKMVVSAGVRRIIYTDTGRDGTLEGPNFKGIEGVARSAEVPMIASGGVGKLEHISRLSRMSNFGIEGVIVGMALYENKFTLAEAFKAVGQGVGG